VGTPPPTVRPRRVLSRRPFLLPKSRTDEGVRPSIKTWTDECVRPYASIVAYRILPEPFRAWPGNVSGTSLPSLISNVPLTNR